MLKSLRDNFTLRIYLILLTSTAISSACSKPPVHLASIDAAQKIPIHRFVDRSNISSSCDKFSTVTNVVEITINDVADEHLSTSTMLRYKPPKDAYVNENDDYSHGLLDKPAPKNIQTYSDHNTKVDFDASSYLRYPDSVIKVVVVLAQPNVKFVENSPDGIVANNPEGKEMFCTGKAMADQDSDKIRYFYVKKTYGYKVGSFDIKYDITSGEKSLVVGGRIDPNIKNTG